jgi:hypothetical protein
VGQPATHVKPGGSPPLERSRGLATTQGQTSPVPQVLLRPAHAPPPGLRARPRVLARLAAAVDQDDDGVTRQAHGQRAADPRGRLDRARPRRPAPAPARQRRGDRRQLRSSSRARCAAAPRSPTAQQRTRAVVQGS